MERAGKVREKAEQMIGKGEKPSALRLSEELGYTVPDIHRCLNYLEREDEVETYRKTVFGQEHRMIGVKRS